MSIRNHLRSLDITTQFAIKLTPVVGISARREGNFSGCSRRLDRHTPVGAKPYPCVECFCRCPTLSLSHSYSQVSLPQHVNRSAHQLFDNALSWFLRRDYIWPRSAVNVSPSGAALQYYLDAVRACAFPSHHNHKVIQIYL